MKKKQFIYALGALWAVLIGSSVHAQQSRTTEVNRIAIEFSVFNSRLNSNDEAYYFAEEGVIQKININERSRGEKFYYSGPQIITFFDYTGTLGTDSFRMIPKARVEVPRGVDKATFFFLPNPQSSEMPYRVFVHDSREATFPYSSVVVFNLTGQSLLMNQGNRMVECPPGPMRPLQIRHNQATFQVYYQLDERRRRMVYNNVVRCAENERVILVFLPPADPATINFQTRMLIERQPVESEGSANSSGGGQSSSASIRPQG